LTAIDAMLLLPDLDDHHRYWLIQALAAVCEKDAAEIGQQAARVAMKYIRSNLAHDDNRTANHVWNCLRGIAVAAPSDEKDLLRQILDSNIAWWVRGIALQRLAGLEGAAGIERLCGALKDRQLRSAAVEALGKQARGTNDPRLMQALAEALEAAREPEFTTTVIQAMLDVGTVPRPILERAISRVDPDTAMTLHWLLNDIRPRRLAQRLVAAGIMALPAKSKLAKYTAAWRKERNAANILRNMLADADRLSGLSCKTDQVPADHADLLRQLARICPPKLAFTDAEQTLEADGGRCRVSFVFDRREHSFVAENRGRYYDLRAIMAGVNKALGGIGREERLFQLYSGGETALMTIALDAPFRAAVQELRIPLDEDPGSPERAGTGYTRHVLSTA
jgi:hypothetical protein